MAANSFCSRSIGAQSGTLGSGGRRWAVSSPNRLFWLLPRDSCVACEWRVSASTAPKVWARFLFSELKAPAFTRLSSRRLLITRWSSRSATSNRSLNGPLAARSSASRFMASRPTPLIAARA